MDAQIKTEEEKKYVEEKKDEELLVSAFNTFYDKVYSYFFYHLHHCEQAQDLTGEVFFKLAAAWSRYDSAKSALSTWIFTIARNLLRDYWRKHRYTQLHCRKCLMGVI